MLAHAPDVAYTTFACLFVCAGFAPPAAARAQMGPRSLLTNLGFVFTLSGWRKPTNFYIYIYIYILK